MPADASPVPVGRIELICGCMFSGKTRRLIEAVQAAQRVGRSVRAFKHRLDRRYDGGQLATHNGLRCDATSVSRTAAIDEHGAGVEVVAIDEAQFFGRELVEACQAMRTRGQHVYVAGIDHDAWGRPFPPLPRLKALADDVVVLHAPCGVCGQPACYSQRLVPVTNPDMVGGPGEYEPRCTAHFHPLPPPAPTY